jgi:GDP-L-fucose synthase
MNFWESKKVLVTGGAGFIGSHLVKDLVNKRACVRVADNLQRGSLNNLEPILEKIEFINADLTIPSSCDEICKDIDIIFNLASKVAGVGYNVKHSSEMFLTNVILNMNMLESARKNDVERYLVVSSACVYPRYCSIPTPESEGFDGDPEPTNLGYGWAKRSAELQAHMFAQEYGLKISIVRPYNAYGPRDYFESEKGHVIPSLIKKVFDGWDPVVIWGDGEQSRSFVYVTDVVKGMLLATENYAIADPINIGSDEEIKIKDLISLILEFSGKTVNVVFDPSKPAGQPRRCPDLTKARKIGYKAEVLLKDGLRETVRRHRLRLSEA